MSLHHDAVHGWGSPMTSTIRGNTGTKSLREVISDNALVGASSYLLQSTLPAFFISGTGVYRQEWNLLDGLNSA